MILLIVCLLKLSSALKMPLIFTQNQVLKKVNQGESFDLHQNKSTPPLVDSTINLTFSLKFSVSTLFLSSFLLISPAWSNDLGASDMSNAKILQGGASTLQQGISKVSFTNIRHHLLFFI